MAEETNLPAMCTAGVEQAVPPASAAKAAGVFSLLTAALLASSVLLIAQSTKPAMKAPKPSKPEAVSGGEISGKVIFSGTPPKAKVLKMDADPVCAAQHPTPVMSEDALIGPDGALQNVLVRVKAGLPASAIPPAPTTPVKIDQKGCIYTPRLVVAMVNQPVEFSNSDDTDHHIQAMAEVNKEWMVSQKKGTAPMTQTFDQEEVGMLVICHLHPWMRMFISVLKNPFYAITGKDGTFSIKGLPPGYYTIEAWHERFGTQSLKVQAGDKADFTFKDE
jgi:plastocyanin